MLCHTLHHCWSSGVLIWSRENHVPQQFAVQVRLVNVFVNRQSPPFVKANSRWSLVSLHVPGILVIPVLPWICFGSKHVLFASAIHLFRCICIQSTMPFVNVTSHWIESIHIRFLAEMCTTIVDQYSAFPLQIVAHVIRPRRYGEETHVVMPLSNRIDNHVWLACLALASMITVVRKTAHGCLVAP